MPRITRKPGWTTYTLGTEGDANVIKFSEISAGSVQTGAAVTIEVYACSKSDPTGETFVVAYDSDGNAIVVTASGAGVWEFPPSMFSLSFIKLVHSGGASVDVFIKG